jgi:transcriptional regulator with XRE-family HTH domain
MSTSTCGTSLAEFLRSCRARLPPADFAPLIEDGSVERRRAPGVRQDELARLAGVSVDYYKRLEQGRSKSPSLAVLEALANALRLDDSERQHLVELAKHSTRRQASESRAQQVSAPTSKLLQALDHSCCPAIVIGRRLDVLAHNQLAGALITDFKLQPAEDRNLARFLFLDPRARELYPDWDLVASAAVAMLRLDAGRYAEDLKLNALLRDLSLKTRDFCHRWQGYKVRQPGTGRQRYRHPIVGELTVNFQTMSPTGELNQTIFVFTPDSGQSEALLRKLADSATNTTSRKPAV